MDKTNWSLKGKVMTTKCKKAKKWQQKKKIQKKKKKEFKGRCMNTNKKKPVKLSSLGMLIRSPIFLIEI